MCINTQQQLLSSFCTLSLARPGDFNSFYSFEPSDTIVRVIKLHNEELNDLYSSPNTVRVIKSRRMRWAGHVACMGEGMGVYRVLVGKPEGRSPLGRPRRRWVNNNMTDLQEVGCGYMDCV